MVLFRVVGLWISPFWCRKIQKMWPWQDGEGHLCEHGRSPSWMRLIEPTWTQLHPMLQKWVGQGSDHRDTCLHRNIYFHGNEFLNCVVSNFFFLCSVKKIWQTASCRKFSTGCPLFRWGWSGGQWPVLLGCEGQPWSWKFLPWWTCEQFSKKVLSGTTSANSVFVICDFFPSHFKLFTICCRWLQECVQTHTKKSVEAWMTSQELFGAASQKTSHDL